MLSMVVYYTYFSKALEISFHRDRIIDVYVIGMIIFFSPYLIRRPDPVYQLIGGLVVLYGLILAVYYSFIQGYKS